MGELINGRTPDEIKIGLRTCPKPRYDPWRVRKLPYKGCDGDCDFGLEDDALALIEHLEAKIPRWISVEERLPEDFKTVIVLRDDLPGGLEDLSWIIAGHWSLPNGVKVTHWMPLPELPKVE